MSQRKKPAAKSLETIAPMDKVRQVILTLRGQRIILDSDLARVYGVETRVLNQQVKRNPDRFPAEFMFQLTWEEAASLRSQIVTLNKGVGERGKHVKYRPFAFTEHGAIMAATVLNSPQAVKASLFVVRAFVQLRELLSTHHELAEKLAELERKLQNHDEQIQAIIQAIHQLMQAPEDPPRPPIGFQTELAVPPAPGAQSSAKVKSTRKSAKNRRPHALA